ncbi:GNAT family N-acetyltransferase [Streptomyces sp. NBC_01216]|uniref:GNAT family N-acetyltransferase n=1 Tax=unclassified Streptomyces TaxID=2593676 RepID=UPI002E11779F|nr:GNAT family N-acetyltransferase [Streptomyces sp. NBC_01216]
MTGLRILAVDGDAMAQDWRHVHNAIIPTARLTLDEVRVRLHRNHLEVAYQGDVLVGCSTVRPPADDEAVATVIARTLAGHRGRGVGEALYARGLARALEKGARTIETVVLSSNEDGLRFALAHGFVETERYLLPGDTIPWVTLRLP